MTASEFLEEYKYMQFPHTLSKENLELLLNEFGKKKWKEAQSDAAAKIAEFKNLNNRPLYCKTPYKP